jgi:PIN domain nuclease of toxin-antitoxin system
MKILPDTQFLLWIAAQPNMLPKAARRALEDEDNELYFSLASIWEIAIKFALGRASFTAHPQDVRRGLLRGGFLELPIRSDHIMAVATLPFLHRDPFDRLLVVQAEVEGLTLFTTDKTLAKYGPHVRRF